MLTWGDDFHELFKRIGELQAILPSTVHIMAVTAMATRTLQRDVCHILGMQDSMVVDISPEKANVFLACNQFTSIAETFGPVAIKLKCHHTSMGRIIIFCKKRQLCNQIFSFFLYYLRTEFMEPPNESISVPEYRLVDMFISGTHPIVKEKIIESFKSPTAPLRVIIVTIAFGLGIDCHDVCQVIHVSPPQDIESYIQHIG